MTAPAVSGDRTGRTRCHTVFTEGRLGTSADGTIAAIDVASGPSAWWPYLKAGDSVRVAARLDRRPGSGVVPFDGCVEFDALPYYVGPAALLRRLPQVVAAVDRAVRSADSVILRVPGPLISIAAVVCRLRRKPYVADVVGDYGDILRAGVLGRLGRRFAPAADAHARWVVRNAIASRYVTQEVLQRRFPPRPGTPSVGLSDVCLGSGTVAESGRRFPTGAPVLITVGTLETTFKGHDLLIEAVLRLTERGVELTAVIVGGGRRLAEYEQLAADRGVADRVRFTGKIADRAELNRLLDEATLFVMPSRQEGLPRAMVEAMSRGLPVIGSRVGGIPELVDAEWVVEPDDVAGLTHAVQRMVEYPMLWEAQSRRSLTVARTFDQELLDARFATWLESIPRPRDPTSVRTVQFRLR